MENTVKRSIIGIILTPAKDEVLLLKRRDVSIWVFPGGGVEPNESPEDAVVREVLEETGLHVRILRHVALYTPLNKLSNHTYIFECERVSGELSTGDETQLLGFFPVSHLPTPLFFLHRDWLADAQKQLPYLIHQPLTQVTYFNLFKYFCRHPIQVIRMLLSRIGAPINKRER